MTLFIPGAGENRFYLRVTGPRSNCSAHLLMANYFNAGKTKNGHETGPQGPDFGLDPRIGYHFSRRIRFRPLRGPGRPANSRKPHPNFSNKKSKHFILIWVFSSLVSLPACSLSCCCLGGFIAGVRFASGRAKGTRNPHIVLLKAVSACRKSLNGLSRKGVP